MNKAVLGFMIISIVLVSGCVGESPTGQIIEEDAYFPPQDSIDADRIVEHEDIPTELKEESKTEEKLEETIPEIREEEEEKVELCIEDWDCSEWSDCFLETQIRFCIDNNYCLSDKDKPAETQSCTCTPNWECSGWSECTFGFQMRTCTDSNNCLTIEGMPSMSQECSTSEESTGEESLAKLTYFELYNKCIDLLLSQGTSDLETVAVCEACAEAGKLGLIICIEEYSE